MSKKLALIFITGIFISLGFAVWQYSLAPEGMLLYTPALHTKPNLTSSSAIGFIVGALSFCAISVLVSLASYFLGFIANRRWMSIAKQSIILAISFGLLVIVTMGSEQLWP